jgi:large subunit ribosomal protein L25
VSKEDITLLLEKREQVRKGLNKIRNSGQLPAVIHDPGKESVNVQGPYLEMLKVYQQAGKHHPVNLKIGDKDYFTIIKDVDFEPDKYKLRHIVFDIIQQNKKVETEVPIVFEGEAPALKAGLLVVKQLDHAEIEAFPRDLPDQLTVNVENLAEVGNRITVADIQAPSGVTILTELEQPIVIVEEKPVEEPEPESESEEIEGEEAEAAEGEETQKTQSEEKDEKVDNQQDSKKRSDKKEQ